MVMTEFRASSSKFKKFSQFDRSDYRKSSQINYWLGVFIIFPFDSMACYLNLSMVKILLFIMKSKMRPFSSFRLAWSNWSARQEIVWDIYWCKLTPYFIPYSLASSFSHLWLFSFENFHTLMKLSHIRRKTLEYLKH